MLYGWTRPRGQGLGGWGGEIGGKVLNLLGFARICLVLVQDAAKVLQLHKIGSPGATIYG